MSLFGALSAGGQVVSETQREQRLRLRGRFYQYRYRTLVGRDGEKCYSCGIREGPFDIHHRDGDTWNWSISNTELRCKSCNTGENNSLRALGRLGVPSVNASVRENVSFAAREAVKPTDNLVSYSAELQRDCWYWLLNKIGPGGPHEYLALRKAINDCAYDIGSHPKTVAPYFHMFSSENGPLRITPEVLPGDRPGRRTKIITYVGSKHLPGEGKPKTPPGSVPEALP